MKLGRHLFARPEECTGCRLCAYACSLRVSGSFCAALSLIHVLGNEEFARFYPAIATAACPCADGEELCAQVCPHDVLRFLDDGEVAVHLRAGSAFVAAPLLDAAGAGPGRAEAEE